MFQGTCLVAVAVYFGDDEYADDGDDDDIGDGDDVFFKLLQSVGSFRTVEGKVRLSDASLQFASVRSTLLKCAHCVLFTSHSTLCTLEGLVLALAC